MRNKVTAIKKVDRKELTQEYEKGGLEDYIYMLLLLLN